MACYVKKEKNKNSQTDSSFLSHFSLKDQLPKREASKLHGIVGGTRFESSLSITSCLTMGKLTITHTLTLLFK